MHRHPDQQIVEKPLPGGAPCFSVRPRDSVRQFQHRQHRHQSARR